MGKVIDFYSKLALDPGTHKVIVATKKTVKRLVNQSKFQIMATMAGSHKPIA